MGCNYEGRSKVSVCIEFIKKSIIIVEEIRLGFAGLRLEQFLGVGCLFGGLCYFLSGGFDWCTFSCAFRDNAQFGLGHVGSACEGIVAFFAFPDAYAFAFDFDESAVRAFVFFLESSYDFVVAFSDSGTIAGTKSSCWSYFFHFGHLFHQSSFLRNSAALSLAILEASMIC